MPESNHDFSTSRAWDTATAGLIQMMTKYSSPSAQAYQSMFQRLDHIRTFSSATTLLDIGCGTGLGVTTLLEADIDLSPNAEVLAIDFGTEMVGYVLETKRKLLLLLNSRACDEMKPPVEVWKRVTAKVVDVTNMDTVHSGTISHAYANFVLFGVSNPEKAFDEILRVLELDGVFAMTSFRRVGWMECMSVIQEVTDQPLHLPRFDPENQWANPESVKIMLDKAGFRDARAEQFEVEMVVDDFETFPRDMMAVPALANASGLLSEAELERGFNLVRKKLHSDHMGADGKARFTAVCIVGWGHK